jgi:predicted enzyme related to lactoylglutathione lyase
MPEQTQTQPQTGTFVWNELMSTDFPKAKEFYTTLFGWKTREMDMGPAGKYTIWINEGKDIGGGMSVTKDMGPVPSHWLAYVSVANVDESAKQAVQLGGKVHVPPMDIPNVGRWALLEDPAGAHIAIITMKS